MVKRKGIGYAIEAFIASLVIFIFVIGGLSTSSNDRDWSKFQDEVGANDLSYVMHETGYTDEMVDKGQTGSIITSYSSITGEKLRVSGSLDNSPVGTSKIGFYAPNSTIFKQNITEVTSGDRCFNDLEEIESEYPILRTTDDSDSLENKYNVRLYISDSDPQTGTGFNGNQDYDTLWIDKRIKCQFSESEGPISDRTLFEWRNETSFDSGGFYDFRSITDETDREMVLHNATLSGEIKRELEDRNKIQNSELVMESFNFSDSSLSDYEILVFQGRESLEGVDENHERILDFNKEGSVMVASSLNSTNLEHNSYLNKTGLKWVNLSYSGGNNPDFTDQESSKRINHYFNSIGCEDCLPLTMQPGGKISSSNDDSYISKKTLLSDLSTEYDTDDWNVENSSMEEDVAGVLGTPTSACEAPYSNGTFEFPKTNGETEKIKVWNTKLGTTISECDGTQAISMDLDDDGNVDEPSEGLYYDNSNLTINNREYNIRIESFNEITFVYQGPKQVEYVNYRTTFPSQDIDKFVRVGNLSQNGELGGSDGEQIFLATALMHWLAEDEISFGSTENSDITHQTVGRYGEDPKIPYELHLRWSR